MKEKTKIRIAIPIVIIAWGSIFFQLSDFRTGSPEIVQLKPTSMTKPKVVQHETFQLLNIKRDPFLGIVIKDANLKRKVKSKPSKKINKTSWPNIQFEGMVEDGGSSNTAIFLINIAGEQRLLVRNQEYEGIKLLSGTSKSVKLQYKNEVKEIELL